MNERKNFDIHKRLEYLEKQYLFTLEALDIARELGDFQASINQLADPAIIIEKTKNRAEQLIEFESMAFFLIDEETSDFYLYRCFPDNIKVYFQGEIDLFIEDGTFSRAVLEKKPVTAYSQTKDRQFLLHVLTTVSRVRGMFAGVLKQHSKYIREASFELFSILMVHCSNALESYELYQKVNQSNQILHEKIKQLSISESKLKAEIQSHKRTSAELASSESNYRLLAETANEIIFKISVHGTVEYANESAINISGYSKDSIHRIPIHDIIDNIKHIMDGNPDSFSCGHNARLLTKSKQIIPLELNITPIHKGDPDTSLLIVARDISERIQFEMERINLKSDLWQSQKMEALGALAGGIAHDFNNILSGIFGFSQLASAHINNPEKAKKNIDQILIGAQKATELVQQILTFTRKSENDKQPLKISIIIKEALKLLRASIPSTIRIEENIQTGSRVLADPIKIHQLIMNLCTNAYHAMVETGGLLTVVIKETQISKQTPFKHLAAGRYIELVVSDTGHGMDSQILAKAFEPYFTTKEAGKGTGMGLSVVQGIVIEHEGAINVESEPGKGSIFTIYLPVIHEQDQPVNQELQTQAVVGGTETIMVIDDEETILDATRNFLEDFGYRVFCFTDGMTAFAEFEDNPFQFDLIITDMTMPLITGDKLAAKMLAINPQLPIFLCTGYSETVSPIQAKALGIREYIQKPMILSDLMLLIRKTLDK